MEEEKLAYAGDSLLPRYMKERRQKAGLTLPALAAILKTMPDGVSESSLAKYENGTRVPTNAALAAWFRAVGVNYWYRDKIRELLSPELFQHEFGEVPGTALPEDIEVLNSIGIPAAFLSDPMSNLVAANDRYLEMFDGLEPGMNVAWWMLTSPVARLLVENWALRTKLLVASIRGIAPGIVPDEEIEQFKKMCSIVPEFETFWNSDPKDEEILNSDVILRELPTRPGGRYISRTTKWFYPKRRFHLYTLTYTTTPAPTIVL